MGSSLGGDSELDVRDSATPFASSGPKGGPKNTQKTTEARVYFASKMTVNAQRGLPKNISRERGIKERVLLNLMFIFQMFFSVPTLQKLIRV